MNTSAIMIALDQDGHFRHESGLPLVCIFDSQDGEKKPITETSWQRPITGIPAVGGEGPKLPPTSPVEYLYSRNSKHNRKPLKFVNTSRPGKKTRKTSKVAKSNREVQDSVRRHRENNNELQISEPTLASTSTSSGVALQPNGKEGLRRALISQQGRCLAKHITTYPIPMKPYMFILLDFYFTMSSLWHSPPQSSSGLLSTEGDWITLIFTDPVLFHVILCCSALHKNQLAGTESSEHFEHMKQAVHLLNVRFQDPGFQISDSTIVSVVHLAEFEQSLGNVALWNLHMEGLHKMVQMRGGLRMLSDAMKSKLLKVEIEGCINTLQNPRFEIPTIARLGCPLPRLKQSSNLCYGFRELSEKFAFDEHLIEILHEAQNVPSIFNTTSLARVDELVTNIQWCLLLLQSKRHGNSQSNHIQSLCNVATLAFLEIVKSSYYPSSPSRYLTNISRSRELLQRLKSCLINIKQVSDLPLHLILWAYFLGSTIGEWGECREWFLSGLRRTAGDLRLGSCPEMELELLRFPQVASIQQDLCRMAWDETNQRAL